VAFDHKNISIEILEHGLRGTPDLVYRIFHEFDAALRCQIIELSAIFDFEDPPCFFADSVFVVLNRIVRRNGLGYFQNDSDGLAGATTSQRFPSPKDPSSVFSKPKTPVYQFRAWS